MEQVNKAKPEFLYRGIVLPYDKLEDFDLSNADLIVPYDPIIGENGKKVVLDGNEYGIYMTANKNMVQDVYGNIHGDGTVIKNDIKIGYDQRQILIPSVGISYEINTQGLDVRQPFIKSSLKGHYNNGFQGDEWIADKVPSTNYEVTRIRIGSDILHEAEDVPIVDGNISQSKSEAIQNIQMRKYRLDSLVNALSSMTQQQRINIGSLEFAVLKGIFGPDGIRYTNTNNIDISNNNGKIKHLLADFYGKESGINFTTLGYIVGLKQKLSKTENPELSESLEQVIIEDLKANEDKKEAFVERKTQEGTIFTTAGFDNKNEMMNSVLAQFQNIKAKISFNNKGEQPQPFRDLHQEKEKLQLVKEEILQEKQEKNLMLILIQR